MALLYAARLSPTKAELLTEWVPSTAYYTGRVPATIVPVGAYRFDDPDGEVGIEVHLVRDDDGTVYQVPLTYRSAPLAGGRPVGEMAHSVLGRRYVYDATTDPVYVRALLTTVYEGGREADQFVHVDGAEPRKVEGTAQVRGTGAGGLAVPDVTELSVAGAGAEGDSLIAVGGLTVAVHHRPVAEEPAGPALLGEWDGGRGVLATVRASGPIR